VPATLRKQGIAVEDKASGSELVQFDEFGSYEITDLEVLDAVAGGWEVNIGCNGGSVNAKCGDTPVNGGCGSPPVNSSCGDDQDG
jgi:hypothetical protein